jgi:hypothetical protein
MFGEGRLLPWTATATLLSKPLEATLQIAPHPAVDRVGMDPEHPRGLGLGHAIQDRPHGPVA